MNLEKIKQFRFRDKIGVIDVIMNEEKFIIPYTLKNKGYISSLLRFIGEPNRFEKLNQIMMISNSKIIIFDDIKRFERFLGLLTFYYSSDLMIEQIKNIQTHE